MKRQFAFFLAIAIFIFMSLTSYMQYSNIKTIYEEKEKHKLLQSISEIRSMLEESINRTFLLINGMVAYVSTTPNLSQDEFRVFAKELIKQNPNIKNASLAPSNIISYTYPIKGNEKALGLNFNTHPTQKKSVEMMIKNKKTVIAGPINLVQGGRAFINRTPIFIQKDGFEEYWGLVSVAIDMESMFSYAGLKNLKNIEIAIRGKDGLGERGEVFFGDEKLFLEKEIETQTINIPNGSWQLVAKYKIEKGENDPKWIAILGFIFSLIFSVLIFYLFDTKYYLNKVNKRMLRYINVVDKNVITSTTNLNGEITRVSEAFCKISGYSKNELIGKNHRIFKDSSMDKKVFVDLWESISNNKEWKGEIKNKTKDGKSYWVDTTITPIYNEKNKKIGYSSIRQDITDKKRIEEISIRDGLTNIYNRRYFNEMIIKLINKAKRNNEYLTLLILDIDYFKFFNDTYGHQEGDVALKEVAKTLKTRFSRAEDYCFRLGGEEFGVIFLHLDKKESELYANKLREDIEGLKIEHKNSKANKYLTVSIGFCNKKAEDIIDDNQIYKEADEMLYKAKENGRNRVYGA